MVNEIAQVAIDSQNPWPGLGAFDETAQRFFNGRDDEAAELRRLVLRAPITMLFGASGLGKTSLIQAGLFPSLRKDHLLPVYIRLDVRDTGAPLIEQVSAALQNQIRARNVEAPPFRSGETVWEYLHRDGLELWSERNQLLTPVIVFDQFEEVFTLGAENAAAVAQLRLDLADLVENRMPARLAGMVRESEAAAAGLSLDSQRHRVLLSIREDFLASLEGWKRDIPSILRNRLRLLPMSGERAVEAVHKTAPHLVDEPNAKRIVRFVAAAQEDRGSATERDSDDVQGLEVEPALLSLVCHGLNEKRKAQGKQTFDEALLSGTGHAIIADYYSGAVADMPPQVRRFVEQELITERGFRKSCDIDDARSVHKISDGDLRKLVDRRLLRIEPYRGTERIELTHDRLTRVVREHRDQEREKERIRRQRARVGVLSAIGVTLATLVVVFVWLYVDARAQRNEAERQASIATSGRLATAALLNRGSQLDLAALLALEAGRSHSGFETRNALFSTFQANPRLRAYVYHSEAVQRVTFSPDGKIVASGTWDGRVLLWYSATGRPYGELRQFEKHPVSGLAFSPDGTLLVTAGATVRIWSIATLTLLEELSHERNESNIGVAFSPDGKTLASAGHKVRLWDVGSRRLISELSEPQSARARIANGESSVVFSADGALLATAGGDPIIRLWDVASRQRREDVLLPMGVLSGELSFSADGRTLFGVFSGRPQAIDVATGTQHADSHLSKAVAVVPSPNGKSLAVAGVDGIVRFIAADSLEPVEEPLRGHGRYVNGLAFSPDGRLLASAGHDKTVRLWELTSGRIPAISLPVSSEATNLAFSPMGKLLASVREEPGKPLEEDPAPQPRRGRSRPVAPRVPIIELWDVANRVVVGDPLRGHTAKVTSVAFSPNGKVLASASHDTTIRLWDTSTREPLGPPLQGHQKGVTALAFSAEGKLLASASDDRSVRLWKLDDQRPVQPPLDGSAEVRSLVFSGDGRRLISVGERGKVRVLDVEGGHSTERFETGFSYGVELRADGKFLAAESDTAVQLWDVDSGQRVGPLLLGHDTAVGQLAFSPDGRTLASGDFDGAIRLWDLATGRQLGDALDGHKEFVNALAFSPDGTLLASAARDKTLLLWDVDERSWAARLCRVANRNLSITEWRQYVGDKAYRRTCPDLPDGEGVSPDR